MSDGGQAPSPQRPVSPTHIVFMGMGEPLLNLRNVLKTIYLMHDEMVVRARVGLGPKAAPQLAAAHERRRRTTAVAVDRRLPILQD